MDHTRLVRDVQDLGRLRDDGYFFVQRQQPLRRVQRTAVDELHRDVGVTFDFADFVHAADAGVLNAHLRPRFLQEAFFQPVVRPQDVVQYRELYSAIFADFHLFEKLYGMPEVKKEVVDQLLQQLRLSGKVAVADDLTMERNLSTGQRKRLAMLVALLEDRPIYVFDEWAADQDPEFRRYFYEDVLSTLRRRGKTVIVVSHDDQYFHCADQLFQMEYGLLRCVPTDPHRGQSSPAGRTGVSG